MIFHLLISVMFVKSTVTADLRAVVLADRSVSADVLDNGVQASVAEGVRRFKEMGFQEVKVRGDVFLFAPKLWQAETAERMAKRYANIAASIGKDGAVDVQKSGGARDIATALFACSGQGLSEDTKVMLVPRRTYDMKVGDRTITLSPTPGISQSQKKQITEHPMRALKSNPKDWPIGLAQERIEWPHDLQCFGFEVLRFNDFERTDLFRAGFDKLVDHLKKVQSDNGKAYSALNRAAFGNFADDIGKSYGALPPSVRDEMAQFMANKFADFGFGSAAEGQQFLKNATMADESTAAMFCGADSRGQFYMSEMR